MTFTDLTPMPFGKYKGTPMQDVPASYLHWLYHNSEFYNQQGLGIKKYIDDNMSALKQEDKDLIWIKK